MKKPTLRQLNAQRATVEKKLDDHLKANKDTIETYLDLVNELSTLTVQVSKALLKEIKEESL